MNCDATVRDPIGPIGLGEIAVTSPATKEGRRSVSENNTKQIEERRVVYVGRVKPSTTLADLRQQFARFGPIEEVKLHFREIGDSYGFVTFIHKEDAIAAVQYGNDNPSFPKYDLCFGGRRNFCQTRYRDLDGTSHSNLQSTHTSSQSFLPACNRKEFPISNNHQSVS